MLYGEGDGIVGERIVAYSRRVELSRIPIPRTNRHRAQGTKLDDAECYVVKPIRWITDREKTRETRM
jgi:hypothetical protein